MPRVRSTEPSVPTMQHWLEIYYAYIPTMIREGKIDMESGKKVAKGLKYSIAAMHRSKAKWKAEKRQNQRFQFEEAEEFFKSAETRAEH